MLIQDQDRQIMLMLVTHLTKKLPQFWKYFSLRAESFYQKHFHWDDSENPGYKYEAIHLHWFNRYTEDVCSEHLILLRS